MKIGDRVFTPRFCTVRIKEIFNSREEADAAGYKGETHYSWKNNDGYEVVGKSLDMYHMEFAAYKK